MSSKKFALAFLLLFMVSGTISAASAWDNAVSFTNVTVSPNPVVAGQNATIRFQLYNSYNFWIYNTNLQPMGTYPLLNVSPLSSKVIGRLNQSTNPAYYNYTIKVPSTTPSGTYTLNFLATYYVLTGTGEVVATSNMPVTFYVQNKPSIKVTALNPQPSALYAGYNQTVQLSIQNNGYGDARNVSVTVTPESGVSILSSVNTFFISNLTQGSSVNEPILVSATSAGNSGLMVGITYYSSNFGERFVGTQYVNLSVAPAAQFTLNSNSTSNLKIGATDVPLRFTIKNTGTSPATQLQLNLQTGYPVTPVQSSTYVASLPVGATTNVTFLVSIDSAAVSGNYPVTLYEQWKQPNGAINQQFTGSENYFASVGNNGSGSTSLITDAVIVIVVIAVAAFVLKRRKAASKSKK